ncbi:MAG: dihydropteroate synthase [Chitinophagia bacterium]|nr:dihydropteroate synthase [Chitinophagia bacterium]
MQDTRIPRNYTLNLRGRLSFFTGPSIMGIINTTPDSFYVGSRTFEIEGALRQAEKMLSAGASWLDIGGVSTRPGSEPVTEKEELNRVIPVIEALYQQFPEAGISVDTYRSRVALEAVSAGACMVNDISGGRWEGDFINTIASLRVPYVLMHSTGTRETLHEVPANRNILTEVYDFFSKNIYRLHQAGIHDIILDPGIGFGKTIAENFLLIKNLSLFNDLSCPLMLAVSRKSFIYKTLGLTPEEALNGTTVLHTAGLLQGASILRVHDVAAAREVIELSSYL